MGTIAERIAQELAVEPRQVEAAIDLLDQGSTVPFIARYRKEATGGLTDTHLRQLAERLIYLRELEERRATIIESVREQGKLTPELHAELAAADTKTRLEDLYLPYRPKRRTKAMIAREAGLEPLADLLVGDPTKDPSAEAEAYVDAEKGVADAKAALEGARHIVVERLSEDADLLRKVRAFVATEGRLVSRVVEEKKTEGSKFQDYFDYQEPYSKVVAHRALALFRGRNEGVLTVRIEIGQPDEKPTPGESMIARHAGFTDEGRPADKWLLDCARWTWMLRVGPHIESDLLADLRDRAEDEAVQVFARNLRDLLLAAPAGPRTVVGLDPGLRTGVKVAVVTATGMLTETATIYPHQPQNEWEKSIALLADLAQRHQAELIAIGNGTASRETDKLAAEVIKRFPDLKLTKIVVSEAGASVYSASEVASEELPKTDVSLRGAVSIARRLQDPLAELVKIDPKSIGVGQYQHDIGSTKLSRALEGVVEDCVNAVGVDLNTASIPLLARVAGLNEGVARNIIAFRDEHGAFRSRQQLMEVPRLGPKTFEQAAGFLRIRDGENPLDNSAVHPEAYPLVERILAQLGRELTQLIGDSQVLREMDAEELADDQYGVPTVSDVLKELEKPGRDPRPEFKTATFREDVSEMSHLQPGMLLEGVVTNVAAFGAFVDVGVHQDGLVHISQLANRFIKDPHTVVKPGDIVKVKVLEVDLKRKRISLTMRLEEPAQQQQAGAGPRAKQDRPDRPPRRDGAKPNREGGPRPNREEMRPIGSRPAAASGASAQTADQQPRRGDKPNKDYRDQKDRQQAKPSGGGTASGSGKPTPKRPNADKPQQHAGKPMPAPNPGAMPNTALAEAFQRALARKG